MATSVQLRPLSFVDSAKLAVFESRCRRRLAIVMALALGVCAVPSWPQPIAGGTAEVDRTDFLPVGQLRLAAGASRVDIDKPPPGTKVTQQLSRLHAEFGRHLETRAARDFVAENPLLRAFDGLVAVDATAAGDTAELLQALEALGLQNGSSYGRMVGGLLPIAAIDELQELPSLHLIRAAMATTSAGLVTNQADAAVRADDARAALGVDGSGFRVGIISDSYDCNLDQHAVDVANGDLPADVIILEERADPKKGFPFCEVFGVQVLFDEGRALGQIVFDIAPGASQAFHTGTADAASFAEGIGELAAEASVDVIVDDVIYFTEPFFQDGPIAQAVDAVVAAGVSYFTSAGNHGRSSYESAFNPSGMTVTTNGEAHDFDPGPGVDLYQQITAADPNTINVLTLQWNEPFFSVSGAPGSSNDLDFYIFDDPPTKIIASSNDPNVGADPVEALQFFNQTANTTYNVVIEGDPLEGSAPSLMKYIYWDGLSTGSGAIAEWQSDSATVVGHSNAAGAMSVGAAAWFETPEFGQDPALVQPYSSLGGTPILFDGAGSPTFESRLKPDVVCPDGGNTTFFGVDIPEDEDTDPNFVGTSASAPVAAGLALQVLEFLHAFFGSFGSGPEGPPVVTPQQVYDVLAANALDMGPPGFDPETGHGLCQAVGPGLAAPVELESQFNPAETASLCSIAVDSSTGELWVYECDGTEMNRFSQAGDFLGSVPLPVLTTANDVDLEFIDVATTLDSEPLPAGTLLYVDGEVDEAEVHAVDVTGTPLATLNTAFGSSHVVGGAYHADRGTLFLLQNNLGGAEANRVAEIDPVTGAVIDDFSIAALFDVAFGDVDICPYTGNLLLVSSAEDDEIVEVAAEDGSLVLYHALPEDVGNLSGIAIDETDGTVWVASTDGSISELGGSLCAPPATIRVRAIEVNQSIQSWRNEVPLYEGKDTVVRVFLERLDAGGPTFGSGLLHGSVGGNPLMGSPLTADSNAPAQIAEDATVIDDPATGEVNESWRAHLGNSVNFTLPFTWIDGPGPLELEFELTDPIGQVLECAEPDGNPNCRVSVGLDTPARPIAQFFSVPYRQSEVVRLEVTATAGDYIFLNEGRESDPVAFNAPREVIENAVEDVLNTNDARVRVVAITETTGQFRIRILRGQDESLGIDDSGVSGGDAILITERDGGPFIAPTITAFGDLREQLRRIMDTFPIASVDFVFRELAGFRHTPRVGTVNRFLEATRGVDRFLNPTRPSGKYFGLMLEVQPDGGRSGMAWPNVSSTYARFAEEPTDTGGGRNTGVHEAAHTYGRAHAVVAARTNPVVEHVGICGSKYNVSAPFHPHVEEIPGLENQGAAEAQWEFTWPTIGPLSAGPDAEIWGFSPRAYRNGFSDLTIIDPWRTPALMSYCNSPFPQQRSWISDFSYGKLRTSLSLPGPLALRAIEGPSQDVLIVSGSYDETMGVVEFDSPITVNSGVAPENEPGAIEVALVDELDQTISSVDVLLLGDGDFPGQEYGLGEVLPSFVAYLPVPGGSTPTAITVTMDSTEIGRKSASPNPPTVGTPVVDVLSAPPGTFEVAWSAMDLDGDPLSASLLLSTDLGLTWQVLALGLESSSHFVPTTTLPASSAALVRVVVSDGFHQAEATSASFTLDAGYPLAAIEQPLPSAASIEPGGVLQLRGDAWDPEDGLLDGAALEWTLDDGEAPPVSLGTGGMLEVLVATLGEGCQILTLTATDSNAKTGTDSVEVDFGATGCLGLIFGDGFESGDTASWSATNP